MSKSKDTKSRRLFTINYWKEYPYDNKGKYLKPIYVAEWREYNIVVQGRTIKELKKRFINTLIGHVEICKNKGLIPFKCLKNEN